MAYDSKYLHRMLQLHGGHVEAGKGHIIKTRYSVVVVVSIFFSVCLFT